jgi:hypothetical protein
MPVSKKRMKRGKPVQRAAPPPSEEPEQGPVPEGKPGHLQQRMGRPANPFVQQQQAKRGAQRGR